MKVEKIQSPARANERCCAFVHLSETRTLTRLGREAKARREGYDPNTCGMRATHRLDGKPFCQNHAGQRALDVLLAPA